MKWRSTVGLVVAFGALLVFYLLYDKNAKMGEEAAREAKKVFKIEEKNVRTIRIVRPRFAGCLHGAIVSHSAIA